MMPIQPPGCAFGTLMGLGGVTGGHGNGGHGNIGGTIGAPKSPNLSSGTASTSSSHSRFKRQSGILSWLDSFMPAVAVFVGGGGSAGSGAAFAGKNSDIKTGAFIGETDKFQVSSEIVNYDPKEKEIYISLDFEYVSGKSPGLMNVGMGALSVDDCSAPMGLFQPPKGKAVTYKGSEWTMMEDGYFVSFTPHLHDGGVYTKVFLNGMSAFFPIINISHHVTQ
jgi:hypothetical protein